MSYTILEAWKPLGDSTTITVTASSVATQIPKSASLGTGSIRIVNSGTNVIYFKTGSSTVTTTVAAGIALLPNTVETFQLKQDDTYIAFIAGSTGNTAYVSWGESA